MAVEGEGGDVVAYTRSGIEKVNCGGVYPLNDEAYILFAYIEKCVKELLPRHNIHVHLYTKIKFSCFVCIFSVG